MTENIYELSSANSLQKEYMLIEQENEKLWKNIDLTKIDWEEKSVVSSSLKINNQNNEVIEEANDFMVGKDNGKSSNEESKSSKSTPGFVKEPELSTFANKNQSDIKPKENETNNNYSISSFGKTANANEIEQNEKNEKHEKSTKKPEVKIPLLPLDTIGMLPMPSAKIEGSPPHENPLQPSKKPKKSAPIKKDPMFLRNFTKEDVAKHNKPKDFWIIYNNLVFDISQWVDTHPGGRKVMEPFAGKDCTAQIKKQHSWINPLALIGDKQIGQIKQ